MTQVVTRDHQEMYHRISHHHLHILIKIKKSNQVFKKKMIDLCQISTSMMMMTQMMKSSWWSLRSS
jgi:hypothetical protein